MRYERHLFVCTNRRDPDAPRGSCAASGSDEIRALLKGRLKEAGLKSKYRINSAGCLDACEFGPVIACYPSGRWYGNVDASDVDELFEREVLAGEEIERLLIDHPSFNKKTEKT